MKKRLLLTGYIFFLQLSVLYPQAFQSSNLPVIIIDTYDQNIDTPYQSFIARMAIIDNGPGKRNHLNDPCTYHGEIQIELHGSSSLWFPKKSYNITTLNEYCRKTKVSLLGMPAEDDWILNAPYQDKTFLRDELAFCIYRQMGHYSSRSAFFELVINGEYRGVYEMQEKIKRGRNRLNIARLGKNDLTGDELTGGYIISLDKSDPGQEGWYSDYYSNAHGDSANYFLYRYPRSDSLNPVQKAYIKNLFNAFERVLAGPGFDHPDSGYRKYINVTSFIDHFILNELSKNVDAYRSSTFFFKDKDSKGDGKLHCGPVWDFDIAWGNADYNGGSDPAGWQYLHFPYNHFVPFWWKRLLSDPAFTSQLKCRYKFLRVTVLDETKLFGHIDEMALLLSESQFRNFTQWPVLNTAVHPNPVPVPGTYAGEIIRLKNWIRQRLAWMDANMPGICGSGKTENPVYTFSDSFSDELKIMCSIKDGSSAIRLELINTLGSRIVICSGNKPAGVHEIKTRTKELAKGMYILKLNADGRVYTRRMLKI